VQRTQQIEAARDLELYGAVRRCDQHQLIAEQVTPRAVLEQRALFEVIHPFTSGGNEDVCGRTGVDLLGEHGA
jgi:hypothetical protein